jgi:hypothetical protein
MDQICIKQNRESFSIFQKKLYFYKIIREIGITSGRKMTKNPGKVGRESKRKCLKCNPK